MKSLLITTIAAVVLVGCGESPQSTLAPESKPVAEAAQPEPPTAKGPDTSIHGAANYGNIEAIKQHLAAGTDVNAKDKYGGTPLHRAVGNLVRKEIVELLIAAGADVNAKAKNGKTPLDEAITDFRTEIANLLRKHGGKKGVELKVEKKKK
ncbi:MAG TPA: ankyrin repeat domain-containing protein [Verrucomicrobia bacterium]|nr:ankyrin repeat domain-containing protein [Verrucomicrobiota bacterium]